jgi:hypothetical protein
LPALERWNHETFCQALADGLGHDAAYRKAGFAGGNGHAARLIERPEVAARLAELRDERERERAAARAAQAAERAAREALRAELAGAACKQVIAALLRLAERDDLKGPAGAREAREALLHAYRLGQTLDLG